MSNNIKIGNDIKITNSLRMKSDDRQWILVKMGLVKGEEVWTNFAYYYSFDTAVSEAGNYLLRIGNAKSMEELRVNAEEISSLMSQIFTTSTRIHIRGES
jgi:hypothetical protein